MAEATLPTPPPLVVADTGTSRSAQRFLRWVGSAAAAFLGAVLLVGAYAKAIDPEAFFENVRAERLAFLLPAPAVAYLALALEVGLGLALVLGVRHLRVLLPAAALVLFFVFLTGRQYFGAGAGEAKNCGCFGNLIERTPKEAFWQDVFTMLPALGLSFLGRPAGPFPVWRAWAITGATALALGFAAAAPALPLDDVATRLKPGLEVGRVCFGEGEKQACLLHVIVDLEKGRHVVTIVGDVKDPSPELLERLPALSDFGADGLDGIGPRLWMLTASSPEEIDGFKSRHAPVFDVRHAPAELLRPLYRRLPRSFLVVDGRVVETYSGFPPLEALSGAKR